MATDLDSPEVIASELEESEAGLMVAYLTEHGIYAKLWGESCAAAWPDIRRNVQIVVRRGDIVEAGRLLEEYRSEVLEIDWDAVDVGQPD